MTSTLRSWLVVLALGAGSGCVQYNERCKGFTENPDQPVGKIGAAPVPLDKPFARSDNNAMGQMVADAFLNATFPNSAPPQIAVYNGGGVRSEGTCTAHDVLPANSTVTRGLVHEILPFDQDFVYVLKVTGQELMDLLQVSANGLTPKPTPLTDPSGNFLQLSNHTQETIDCSQPLNSRVTSLLINDSPVDLNATYELASIDFLFAPGSAFTPALDGALGQPQRQPVQAVGHPTPTPANLAEVFMGATYGPETAGLTLDQSEGPSHDQPRTVFLNCTLPE